MSSREIAELTGKRHADVMRDIRVILADLEINERKFASVYIDAKGEQPPCFNLPKRETMVLVSGYSVVLRARIVDRWMELEELYIELEFQRVVIAMGVLDFQQPPMRVSVQGSTPSQNRHPNPHLFRHDP